MKLHVVPWFDGKWRVLDERSVAYVLWSAAYPVFYALGGRQYGQRRGWWPEQ